MVVDGMAGCNALDQEIARFLRQQKVPVILAVNKCESQVTRKERGEDRRGDEGRCVLSCVVTVTAQDTK